MNDRYVIRVAAMATLACVSGTTLASSIDWSGLGADNLITNNANWAGDLAPAAGDIAHFGPLGAAPARTPTIATASLGGIAVDNSGGYIWSLPGSGTLTLGGDGVSVSGGGLTSLGSVVSLSTAQNWTVGANTTLQMAVGSNITGSGKLTKLGSGTLVLNSEGAITHTGTIDIRGGVLANPRQTNGTGGLANLVSIYNTGIYETRSSAGNVGTSILAYDGATIRGNGASAVISSSSGSHLRLDTSTDMTLKLATVGASDALVLLEEFVGGTANSVIEVAGPGTVRVRTSSGTGSGPYDATNSFLGKWKVTSGTLSLEQHEGGLGGTTVGGITVGRPVELAGGTVRVGMNANGSAALSPAASRSAFSVTANSAILVERYASNYATLVPGSTTRTIGPLALNASTLEVSSGRLGENGTGSFIAKLVTDTVALTGTPTFNVHSGLLPDSTPVAMEMEVNAVSGGFGLIKEGNGTLYLTKAANTYTGATTVNSGTLRFVTGGIASTSAIHVAGGATVRLGNGTATSTKADLSGSGVISIPDNATNKLSLQGSNISPGSSAGILTFTTIGAPIELALDDTQRSTLNIQVLGGGAVAGVDYDRLAISHALNGLANADLIVDISGVTDADLLGDVLTIVSASSDFTGQSFASVTINGGNADVNYNNGSITLSNLTVVPEPGVLGLAGMAALLVLRRRTHPQAS